MSTLEKCPMRPSRRRGTPGPCQSGLSAAQARHDTDQLIKDLATPRQRADALLVVSELVTNAQVHGNGIHRFEAEIDGTRRLRVRVADHNCAPPEAAPLSPGHPGGFGWFLVERLASDVTVQPLSDDSKNIVVCLPLA